MSLTTLDLSIGYSAPREAPKVVADSITVVLRAGELACLIGPNGAGKSTLLRTLVGMQSPLAGRVHLGGDDAHRLPANELAQRLAVVLTERVDAGNLSAYALVALGRHPHTDWRGRLTGHDEEVVRRAMTAVGAAVLAPRRLSGPPPAGQQEHGCQPALPAPDRAGGRNHPRGGAWHSGVGRVRRDANAGPAHRRPTSLGRWRH